MIAVDVYRTLGQNLEEIAQDWDHDSLVAHSPEKVGDIEYCHQVAMVAFQLAVLRNDSLPLSWLSVQGLFLPHMPAASWPWIRKHRDCPLPSPTSGRRLN